MMENNSSLAVVAVLALSMCLLLSKRIDRMQREIDLIADGDLETLKLKRKLDGHPDE